jgi:hypothetical protein
MADKPKPTHVPVVTKSGRAGYLPAAISDEVEGMGLRRASDEDLRGAQVEANREATAQALRDKFSGSVGAQVEGAVMPALAGAARGLSLGGSDEFITNIGGEGARKRLEDYKDFAPVSSAVGELGAIAGASLLGDESTLGALPNAIARLGAGAESMALRAGRGALARGAGVLAKGAAEGAVYGAGSAVSEAALKDQRLTGEALVGGAFHGALGGAVASGVLHGAGAALGGVKSAFGGLRAPKASAVEAIAAREFGEAAPGVGKAVATGEAGPYRTTGGVAGTAADTYIGARNVVAPAKTPELEAIWKNRQIAFNDSAERVERHARELTEAISVQQKAAKVTDAATFGESKTNHMVKLVDREQFVPQAERAMDWMHRAQAEIGLLAENPAVTGFAPRQAKALEGHMLRMTQAMEKGDSVALFTALDNAKRFVGREAQFGRGATGLSETARAFDGLYQGEGGLMHVLEDASWGKAGEAQKVVNAATTQSIGLGKRFRTGFTTEYGAEAGRPDFVGNSEKVSSFLGRLTKAANDNDATAVRDMIATRRKFLDATSGSYDHGAEATAAIAAERKALDSMEATFGTATKETALINQVKRLQSEEQAGRIGGFLGLAVDSATKPVTMLQRIAALEDHTEGVLKGISRGSSDLVGGAPSKAAGLPPPKSGARGFFSTLINSTKPIGGPATTVVAAGGSKVARARFEDEAARITSLKANPAALSSRVGEAFAPMGAATPKTTAAATSTAIAGVAFLASKLPPSRQDPFTLQPQLQQTSRASDSEISKFSRYKEALDNPMMVLKEAKSGTLTREHVEAVKAVYPALYSEMRNQVMAAVVDSKSELPYGRRIQLGILLDIPTDKTLSPDFLTAIQATYSPAEKAGNDVPAPTRAPHLNVASSFFTSTQNATQEGLER